ncbi:MAG TPA: peptidylprolyl isomerase [Ramlibacter sp.]|uniref:peptidylprolyl isomerase n=1 Tax=Ramlibacter sp. TaxID=1917967 RepID=UPI002D7EB355|nr:peptidylprolyl isomerase [Ramlibacter sp.]HET8748195.1 peptidylprolyl isomerase [Ramlibacter sp.]
MNIEQQPAVTARRTAHTSLRLALAAACMAAACHMAYAQNAPVFAKVGESVITSEQYEAAFQQAARGKFYHGNPSEAAIAQLQREVLQKLVDEALLHAEAQRRAIAPDAAAVQKVIAGYDERYKDSAQWKANRGKVLPDLEAKLERDNVMEQLTAQVKNVPAPTPEQLQKYYDDHKDKFTSPEQVHIRLILLKVDPSAPKAQWDGAKEEGAAIAKRLRAGADFAELAHLHSGDDSAKRGGDMGYIHRGMLPEAAEKAIDALQPGGTSDAIVLLEGVAVIRLEARKQPVLNPLAAVRQRAQDLYVRDAGEQAWTALLAKLRRDTPVQLDESRFLPLAANTGDPAPAR